MSVEVKEIILAVVIIVLGCVIGYRSTRPIQALDYVLRGNDVIEIEVTE